MKGLLYILLFATTICNAQLLKFATAYASYSTGAPFAENQVFMVDGSNGSGQLVEMTQVSPANYSISIGLRKIARFDYQVKQGRFYEGDENEVSDYATISNAPGIEYVLEYTAVRARGVEFKQHDYRVRYLHNKYTVKAAYINDGLIDLKYTLADGRGRMNLGNIDITVGVVHRTHPVYGYSPVEAWFAIPENKHWWQLAHEFGYTNEGEVWSYEGEVIAGADPEFYTYHFGSAVNAYNKRELSFMGLQQEISAVIGVDYYYAKDNVWAHVWGSSYLLQKGLSDFSYKYGDTKREWDLGVVLGAKLGRHLGVFAEGRHLKYWDIESYQLKVGVNYLIF